MLIIYITLVTSTVVTSIVVVPRLVSEVRSFVLVEVPSMRRRAESTWIPRVTPWIEAGAARARATRRADASPRAGPGRRRRRR
ncbi:MAG: hypothetical protein R3A48_01900 [Polyangiales bacterium]